MKKIYILSLKLFALQALFLSVAMGVYHLLVNIVFDAEKLMDVLLLTAIFKLVAWVVAFVAAARIVKRNNNDIFSSRHRLVLLFYTAHVFVLLCLFFGLLMIFNDLTLSIFLVGGSLLLLYLYYYFARLVYYVAFFGTSRTTAAVFAVLLLVGYLAALVLPIMNYQEVYSQTEVSPDFTYFHALDLSAIAGERELEDKNSAQELTELINLIAADEPVTDEGEQLSYVLPTDRELELLAGIADNKYVNFSEEYLAGEVRGFGDVIVVPLNGLRSFSRGTVKLAARKKAAGAEDEARDMLNDLLFLGNQMIDTKDYRLLARLVGQAIMENALDGLLEIGGSDEVKAGLIADAKKELTAMRNGSRLLQTAAFHMNDEIAGSSKNAAVFFKHFHAQKDNIGNDFDDRLIANSRPSLARFITPDSTGLEKLVLSVMVLPIMAPFELNVGNDYIVYKEIEKISQEPGHDLLKYYFESSSSDFWKAQRQAEEAEFISGEIFKTAKQN